MRPGRAARRAGVALVVLAAAGVLAAAAAFAFVLAGRRETARLRWRLLSSMALAP